MPIPWAATVWPLEREIETERQRRLEWTQRCGTSLRNAVALGEDRSDSDLSIRLPPCSCGSLRPPLPMSCLSFVS
eukprot:scaffold318237_cov36-Tisochrysis_lutea.AAC.1